MGFPFLQHLTVQLRSQLASEQLPNVMSQAVCLLVPNGRAVSECSRRAENPRGPAAPIRFPASITRTRFDRGPMKEHDQALEPSAAEMRRLVERAMDRIVHHLETLPRQPAADVEGGAELARSLREPLPETGQPYESLLGLIFDRLAPKSFNTAGPGYLAYIPGGGLFQSAVADLIGDTVNRYVGVWLAAPGLAQLEANVVQWLCEIVGYPVDARGFLTSGGSLANFSAIVTARRARLPEHFLSGTIYVSDQAHHSVQKAAMLPDFPGRNVREIPSDHRS